MPEKAKYSLRKSQGLCVWCGSNHPTKGVACDTCKAKIKERDQKRKADTICLKCGRPNAGTHYLCPSCYRKHHKRHMDWYHRNRESVNQRQYAWKKRTGKYGSHTPAAKARKARWAKAHPDKVRLTGKRYRARKHEAKGIATIQALLFRWNFYAGLCWICHKPACEWDHVIPLSKGGAEWPSNQRPVCRSCNAHKSANLSFRLRSALPKKAFLVQK